MKFKNLGLYLLAALWFLNFASPVHAQFIDAVKIRELTRSLLKAKSPQERADLLATNKELVSVPLRRWLISEGTTRLAEARYAEASDAFNIAKEVAEQAQDQTGVATASLNIGTVLFLQANYDAALESYQQARGIFARTKDRPELARALMGIGFVYKEQGKLDEALDYLKQSQREFEALGSAVNTDELADVINAIGSVYQSQGKFSEAIKIFESGLSHRDDPQSILRIADALQFQGSYLQAIEYYEKVLRRLELEPEKHGPGVAIAVFGNLANVYYRLGNYDISLKHYLKSLSYVERLGDRAGMALTLEGIGNAYRQLGDFGAALENYFLSLKNAEESGGRVSSATALTYIGTIRATQGNTTEALEYFSRSLSEFERRGDKVGMARALVNIGNSSYVLGDLQRALDVFHKALSLREEMNERPAMADVLLGIGTIQGAQRNFTAALETLRRGLAISEEYKDDERISRTLREMAKGFALQNDHTQALVLIERAVASATRAGARDLQWRTNLDKGKYTYALNRSAEARLALAESIRLIEDLQASSCSSFLDQTWAAEVIEPYAELVRILVDEGKAEEAFITVERGKAQAFRSVFRKDELRINKPLNAAERQTEQRSFSMLLGLELELARMRQRRTVDEKAITAVRGRLTQSQTACVNVRKGLYLRYPQLPVYRGELPRLKSVADAGIFVADGKTVLLEFLVTDTTTYLFVLTRESKPRGRDRGGRSALRLQVYPIPIQRSDLAARLAAFTQSITNREEGVSEKASQLYGLLLRPAEELLRNKSNIVVAPDRELWSLPFQALQSEQGRYLIEQAAISYVPSMSVMAVVSKPALTRRRAPRVSEAVMIVNPSVPQALARRVELTSGSSSVVMIPQMRSVSFKTLSGPNAHEDAAKQEFTNHSLISFSTTTVIDDASPLASFAVLTPSPETNTDGLLHVWETMQSNSSAQVVLMPFASLARKQVDTGIGVTAMTWSWFLAGTPTTIISQWSADPDPTIDLLDTFRELRRSRHGAQPSHATVLQSAIRSFLNTHSEYRHPFYWSGLRLLGNAR